MTRKFFFFFFFNMRNTKLHAPGYHPVCRAGQVKSPSMAIPSPEAAGTEWPWCHPHSSSKDNDKTISMVPLATG